jgi:cyanophycinase
MRAFLVVLFFLSSFAHAKGTLLLIGGGNRSRDILVEMVKLASKKILIVPLASEIPDEVSASAKSQLEEAGATSVIIFACTDQNVDRTDCLSQIRETNLIYFTGGSQNKLLNAFRSSIALSLIREKFESDLHLAGTSAGTAVMSEVMITGEAMAPYERLEGVRQNMVETIQGFSFVKEFIVDQHFIKRQRQNRLLSAVLDKAPHVGIGIDESTALLVRPDGSMTVLGDSLVTVFDARKAETSVMGDGTYVYQNVSTSLLAPGTTFRLP